MANERPDFGKAIILSYEDGSLSYPVIGIRKNPTAPGYVASIPLVGAATGLTPEIAAAFPDHRFLEVRSEAPDQTLLWVYVKLPGPSLPGAQMSDEAQGATVTTAKQRLSAAAADYSPDWKTIAYSDTPIDANRKERNVVTLGDAANAAEVSRVVTTGITIPELSGKYLTLDDQNGPVGVWFDVGNLSTNPAPTGYRMIEVNLTATGNHRTVVVTTGATTTTLDGKFFEMEDVSSPVAVWFDVNGASTSPVDHPLLAGHRLIEVDLFTGVAEVSTVQFSGATAALADEYFSLADAAGPVGVWFNTGLSSNPAPGGHRMIEVEIAAAAAEVTEVDFGATVTPADLANTWFPITGGSGLRYVWFNLDAGGVDPAPGGTGIAVPIVTGQTPDDMAAEAITAIDADADFSCIGVIGLPAVIEITDAATGPRDDASGTVHLTVTVTTQGTDGDTDEEIAAAVASALDADASYTASAVGTLVTITDVATGARTNIASGTSGLTVATLTQGVTESTAPEIATAIAAALDADAQFTASVTATNTATINDVAVGPRTASDAGDSGLAVTSSMVGEASAATQEAAIATALAAALDADAQFAATVSATNTVTITDAAFGDRVPITSGLSGLAVSTVTEGTAIESYPILVEYDREEESRALITTTYQIVSRASVVPSPYVIGRETRYVKINRYKSLKIERTMGFPFSYTEKRIMAYQFPALFNYLTYGYNDACGAFSQIRAAYSTLVVGNVSISFSPSVATITPISIKPKTLQMGKGVQIPGDVLVDSGSFTYSGSCTGTVEFGGSSPTFTQYIFSYLGRSHVVAGESVRWKFGYYRNMSVSIIMQ